MAFKAESWGASRRLVQATASVAAARPLSDAVPAWAPTAATNAKHPPLAMAMSRNPTLAAEVVAQSATAIDLHCSALAEGTREQTCGRSASLFSPGQPGLRGPATGGGIFSQRTIRSRHLGATRLPTKTLLRAIRGRQTQLGSRSRATLSSWSDPEPQMMRSRQYLRRKRMTPEREARAATHLQLLDALLRPT